MGILGIYTGIGGVHLATDFYVGVNGPHKVKEIYIGANGVKKVYPSSIDIYNNGKEYIPFTLATKTTNANAPQVRRDANCITIYNQSKFSSSGQTVWGYAGMYSSTPYDLTPYTYIRITACVVDRPNWYPARHYISIMVGDKADFYSYVSGGFINDHIYGNSEWTHAINQDFEVQLNVKNFNGKYYIKVCAYTGYYRPIDIFKIKKVSLIV